MRLPEIRPSRSLAPLLIVLALLAACADPPPPAQGPGETAPPQGRAGEGPLPHAMPARDSADPPRGAGDGEARGQRLELPSLALSQAGGFAPGRLAVDAYPAGNAWPEGHAAPPAGRVDREHYLRYPDNGVLRTQEAPVSTFGIDVDTASYSNVRRMLLTEGRLPPRGAVRLEEMINYFAYDHAAPEGTEEPFAVSTELAPAPWNPRRQLLQIGIRGYQPDAGPRPPANLVFLVDVSGSMQAPDKLPLVKHSLRLLVNQLGPEDRIALTVYAGSAGTVLESTPGNRKATILDAIDSLEAGGSTHGSAGIQLAYALAEQHFLPGGINRVIIASDGDLNVGTVNLDALRDLVARKRERGVALTTLGFGRGNYNDALMEQLADVGNGNAAYIDTLREAQKVLVNEMRATLHTIASDVKIQVEFNPAVVSEYRLIGYENRLLAREDFANDRVDAGDIGAGHSVTALYELTLAGSGAERIPALRYGAESTAGGGSHPEELAEVRLRYKRPGEAQSRLLTRVIRRDSLRADLAQSSNDLRFAASVAGFGQLLTGGEHTGQWGYTEALALARGARDADPHGYRSELVHLIELAQALSSGS